MLSNISLKTYKDLKQMQEDDHGCMKLEFLVQLEIGWLAQLGCVVFKEFGLYLSRMLLM